MGAGWTALPFFNFGSVNGSIFEIICVSSKKAYGLGASFI